MDSAGLYRLWRLPWRRAKNASAHLFMSAKISHSRAPCRRDSSSEPTRVVAMINQGRHTDGFGSCSNEGECEAVLPQGDSDLEHRPHDAGIRQGHRHSSEVNSGGPYERARRRCSVSARSGSGSAVHRLHIRADGEARASRDIPRCRVRAAPSLPVLWSCALYSIFNSLKDELRPLCVIIPVRRRGVRDLRDEDALRASS